MTETLRVRMLPSLKDFGKQESGIKRVCAAYQRYGPQFGINYVEKEEAYDLLAIHAGTYSAPDYLRPIVAHIHGLYWTDDYDADIWEWRANASVIASIRVAEVVTVPSEWVAKTLQRDMHIDPIVIPHGIEWDEWQFPAKNQGYVLWNKNRNADVCSPDAVRELAIRHPDIDFFTTFAPKNSPSNVFEIGLLPHEQMKTIIAEAAVYLSTTKETFGIGTLEAMAAGVPVLGFAHGGNLITVQHRVSGYLATPKDYEELSKGLQYILQYREVLSKNARKLAKRWSWESAVEKIAKAYRLAIERWKDRRRPYVVPYAHPLKVEAENVG